MKHSKKYLFLLLASCFLLLSCSPQRRIARIAKKYNLTQKDTVRVNDTLTVPGDTLWFTVPAARDTVIVTETATIETVRDGEIIHVKVTTPPDTIIRTIRVPFKQIVVNTVEKERKFPWFLVVIIIAMAYLLYAQNIKE